jgi:PDZ domain-containing secreted protein
MWRSKKNIDIKDKVVLIKILKDEVNTGYELLEDNVVHNVNGTRIKTMENLIEALRKKKKGSTKIVFEDGDQMIVIDSKNIEQRGKAILDKYKVPVGYSRNYRKLFGK